MATDGFPTTWRDPGYIATIVCILATGALVFYSELTGSGPTVAEIGLVLLIIFLPAGLVYEAAKRWL